MENHRQRKTEIFKGSLPTTNKHAMDLIKKHHEEMMNLNPKLEKEYKKKFESAINSLNAQMLSGAGLLADNTIREYLHEFNSRTWARGLREMPAMFNVLEAFFIYQKSNVYFELIEEEDYVLSFFDFINYIDEEKIIDKQEKISEDISENIIYNYNVGIDIDNIIYKSSDDKSFVIGGVALIRRGNEITVLMTCGEVINGDISVTIDKQSVVNNPHKAPFEIKDKKVYPVYLNDDSKYLKTLIACRFDLDTKTIESRYIAIEFEDFFHIITDDIVTYLNPNGEFINNQVEEVYKINIEEIKKYESMFEVAKQSLYLPYYFNEFEDDLIEETHETKFKQEFKSPLQRKNFQNISSHLKIPLKEVYILNRKNKFLPDRITLRDDLFKVETSGYWKTLGVNEVGIDKKNNPITGKTWVNKTLSWLEGKNDELIIQNENNIDYSQYPNAGYIYLLRNPTMEVDVFKIGLTTKTPEERAKQLSKTSVPDKFYTIDKWFVKDCKIAEKEIHELLNSYRVDPRREFFKILSNIAIEKIIPIIQSVNARM